MLEVENLTVQYARSPRAAIADISLSVAAGECLGLVGESGCGKSTLGRSLIDLLPAGASLGGSVSLDGEGLPTLITHQKITRQSPYQLPVQIKGHYGKRKPRSTPTAPVTIDQWRGRKVGFVFQDPMTRLDPLMTIADHGMETLRAHFPHHSDRWHRRRLIDTLQAVRIDPSRANQYPHEFSGGMRQRVAIALALLLDPVLLIADEPTTSLDITVATEILQELTDLRRSRGMGLILITHDLGLVGAYCDRVAVMYDGAIVEMGKTQQIFQAPKHAYTQSLLRSVLHFPADTSTDTFTDTFTDSPADAPSDSSNSSEPTDPLLTVRQLTKQYGSAANILTPIAQWLGLASPPILAVNGIDLAIARGETFGMIGESGSGKSTTARLMLQLTRPDRGSVVFDGVELTRLKGETLRQQRSHMQMIFQDPRACLNPHMTIWQSVADPLLIYKRVPNFAATRIPVLEMLGRVGLGETFLERRPKELSGGQLQRVAIARALILHPKLVICDEPVSMLDATIQAQVLELMLELKREFQLTYFFITHDLAVARWFCDRLAVMQHGNLVEQGTSQTLFTHAQHPYTQKLIASIPQPCFA